MKTGIALLGSLTVPGRAEQVAAGLHLVEMLSARWSSWHDEAGTVIWFELAASDG